jgi:hypothetical protein
MGLKKENCSEAEANGINAEKARIYPAADLLKGT